MSEPLYNRFTDRACKVLQLANQEAQRLFHEYIGTEHLLLGLVHEGTGVAAIVLRNHDLDLQTIRLQVERIVQPGLDGVMIGRMPQTPRAKKVIEYAIDEARAHAYVGTEHLLLGLLREAEGVAAQILMNLGLNLRDVREEVRQLQGGEKDCRVMELRPRWVSLQELPREEFPAEVRQVLEDMDAEIASLNQGKEAAVMQQDFERAAFLRDRADRLGRRKRTIIREWYASCRIDRSWLTWNGGVVVKIARTICEERRWEAFPVLADALEEAGCTDRILLDHCRRPGEHVRGCWLIDLLLEQR
jgi:hypothetical protein